MKRLSLVKEYYAIQDSYNATLDKLQKKGVEICFTSNYNLVGDTLETVSGGSHPGLMHIKQTDKGFEVTAFDQVEDGSNNLPSAKRIFGDKYENFRAVNSDDKKREKNRAEILANYVKKHNIAATKYKDYGWPEKQIPLD